MQDDSTTEAPDFQGALMSELGVEPPSDDSQPDAPTPPAKDDGAAQKPSDAGKKGEQPVDEPAGSQDGEDKGTDADKDRTDEEKAAEAEEAEKSKDETPEQTEARHKKEADEKAKADEPKPLTKEDIANLLNERESASSERISQVKKTQEDIINKLYPQGIDKNVYDTDGKVIKTAQDIVDRGLINDRTGNAFTYEEAASFMLEAGRKMAENIAELEKYAEGVAEKNVSLSESNKRVMAKWGETLTTLPKEKRELLAAKYIETQLTFDKTNSYITNVAMTPEDFYDIALAPYRDLNAELARNAELTQERDSAISSTNREKTQRERSGLPQRGTSQIKANTGNVFTDALLDEMAKG